MWTSGQRLYCPIRGTGKTTRKHTSHSSHVTPSTAQRRPGLGGQSCVACRDGDLHGPSEDVVLRSAARGPRDHRTSWKTLTELSSVRGGETEVCKVCHTNVRSFRKIKRAVCLSWSTRRLFASRRCGGLTCGGHTSKCGPKTGSTRTPWELVKKANAQAHVDLLNQKLSVGSSAVFYQSLWVLLEFVQVRETLDDARRFLSLWLPGGPWPGQTLAEGPRQRVEGDLHSGAHPVGSWRESCSHACTGGLRVTPEPRDSPHPRPVRGPSPPPA